MATDTSSAYIRSLNICIYGESLSHPTGVTSVFAACTVTVDHRLSSSVLREDDVLTTPQAPADNALNRKLEASSGSVINALYKK